MTIFESRMMRVQTPDGQMYVNVMEDKDGDPFQVIINIGKAGSSVAAWAGALGAVISAGLQSGTKLEVYLTELSNITSDGSARTIKSPCRSGPEGVWVCLVRYRKEKFKELRERLGEEGLLEDEDDSRINSSTSRD